MASAATAIAAAESTRNWLEDDRLWVDPCPLDFLFDEETVVVVTKQNGGCEASIRLQAAKCSAQKSGALTVRLAGSP